MKTFLLVFVFVVTAYAAGISPLKAAVDNVAEDQNFDIYDEDAIIYEDPVDDPAAESTESPDTGSSVTSSTASPGIGSSVTSSTASPGIGSSMSSLSSDGTSDFTDGVTSDEATTSTSIPTTQKPDEGLSPGAIAGIVIGSVAGVAIIGGGVFFMYKKKKACFK